MEQITDGASAHDAGFFPLTSIIPDEDYQARENGLSESHVELLTESNPNDWPPLLVEPLGNGMYGLRDGFHRYAAAERLGVGSLRCTVVDGAGYPEAVAANIRHGLPLSKSDRKAAARWWAEYHPELSHSEIARRVGLSDKTVSAAIRDVNQQPGPKAVSTPTSRLVSQVLRIYDSEDVRRDDFLHDIEAYSEEWRADVARAVHTIGSVLIESAAPFLKGR